VTVGPDWPKHAAAMTEGISDMAAGTPAVEQRARTSRVGGTGAWLAASSAGTNHRFDAGGHEGSGWYHRGWGGTMAPGWGYGFGPNLGGSGGL